MTYAVVRPPASAPPKDVKVAPTAERLARGKHLYEHVLGCDHCHSEHDWTREQFPILPGRKGVGQVLPPEMGLPGKIVAANITPDPETGLGKWTDGEKIRAIREGVSRDGRALFPMMPYQEYAHLSDEDAYALVAYLNTLQPVRNPLPRSEVAFPVSVLMKSAPAPVSSVAAPDPGDTYKYGEYLAVVSGCTSCHTPMEKGQPDHSKFLAGGHEFRAGPFLVRSANISPSRETGIGAWDEQRFMAKFQSYRGFDLEKGATVTQQTFTVMPWANFAQMEDRELRAIYHWLSRQKPLTNVVNHHPAN